MKTPSTASLRRRRQQLIRALPPIEHLIRGSLIETYKRCGHTGCHCADGPGHGPKPQKAVEPVVIEMDVEPLPEGRTTDYEEARVLVTSSGGFILRCV